MLRSNI